MMNKQLSVGLKIWSTNDTYVEEARRLFREGVCQYIELYIVPGSYEEHLHLWADLKVNDHIPFIIHAPHYRDGMNLAIKDKEASNKVMIEETKLYADFLRARTIIYHPGIAGDINETIRQLLAMNDSRIVVENKPYFTVDQSAVCNGHAPEQLQKVMQEANVGICLDMGHAICAANALKEEPLGFIKRFIALAPTMYHLTDGDFHSTIDSHQHFGQGSFPLKEILSLIPSGSVVTNEAVKDSKVNLNDVIEDVSRLKAYLNG